VGPGDTRSAERSAEKIPSGVKNEGGLQPAGPALDGFRNLVHKENREWLAGWSWLVHGVAWLLLVTGVPLVVGFIRAQGDNSPQNVNEISALLYFVMGSVATVIAVVAKTQSAIIGEKQMGTAAWVLSKPTSRKAFVLAKLVVHFRWLLVLTLGVPGVVFYAVIPAFSGLPIPILPFLGGFGVLALGMLFYLALSLLLGAVFGSRGAVAAVVFGFFVGGVMLSQYAEWMTAAFPWLFWESAYYLVATSDEVPAIGVSAIILTAVWSVVLVAGALWSFERSEV
jgi:ABC-2 type transport system permease protein